jgi:hypothetical protein
LVVVIRFRNISGFAAAIKEVFAIGTRLHALLEKQLIHSHGNKDAYKIETIQQQQQQQQT